MTWSITISKISYHQELCDAPNLSTSNGRLHAGGCCQTRQAPPCLGAPCTPKKIKEVRLVLLDLHFSPVRARGECRLRTSHYQYALGLHAAWSHPHASGARYLFTRPSFERTLGETHEGGERNHRFRVLVMAAHLMRRRVWEFMTHNIYPRARSGATMRKIGDLGDVARSRDLGFGDF